MEKDDILNYFNIHNELYRKLERLVELEGDIDNQCYTILSYTFNGSVVVTNVEYYEYQGQGASWAALTFDTSYFYNSDLINDLEILANETKTKRKNEKLLNDFEKQKVKDLAEIERLQKKYL